MNVWWTSPLREHNAATFRSFSIREASRASSQPSAFLWPFPLSYFLTLYQSDPSCVYHSVLSFTIFLIFDTYQIYKQTNDHLFVPSVRRRWLCVFCACAMLVLATGHRCKYVNRVKSNSHWCAVCGTVPYESCRWIQLVSFYVFMCMLESAWIIYNYASITYEEYRQYTQGNKDTKICMWERRERGDRDHQHGESLI